MSKPEARRIFELYVDELEGESQSINELLMIRLRYFSEDIQVATERIREDPSLVVELVQHLSSRMQELDTEAGTSNHARKAVAKARLALLLPETGISEERGDAPERDR